MTGSPKNYYVNRIDYYNSEQLQSAVIAVRNQIGHGLLYYYYDLHVLCIVFFFFSFKILVRYSLRVEEEVFVRPFVYVCLVGARGYPSVNRFSWRARERKGKKKK